MLLTMMASCAGDSSTTGGSQAVADATGEADTATGQADTAPLDISTADDTAPLDSSDATGGDAGDASHPDCTATAPPCTIGAFDPKTGECTFAPAPDGAACDDGSACTQLDTCSGGACIGGDPVVCEGADQCHELLPCDPETGQCGMDKALDGAPCDDEDACTQMDTCLNGACQGSSPVICPASDPCDLGGACDPETGNCQSGALPDGAPCDDANVCTGGDSCEAGVCIGLPVDCDDGVACTADSCDEALGGCTTDGSACPCLTDVDCDDGNPCSGTETCEAQTCKGGTSVVCTAFDGPCTKGVCDPLTGGCSTTPKANGAPCSDGDLCTLADACNSGACVGASQVECSAADGCHTAGTCDPATGTCSSPAAPDGLPCDDGAPCTTLDTCIAGSCQGGAAVACTPAGQCHDEGVCDPTTGACTPVAAADGSPCDDGDVCSADDACSGGVCVGAPLPCDDGVACTVDYCDADQGGCTSDPAGCSCDDDSACDDGNPCNGVETCNPVTLQCKVGAPPNCSSLDGACTKGVCQAATGECAAIPVAPGTPCDDGDACTQADSCKAGQCKGADPVLCSKGSQCQSVGTCDPATGQCSQPLSPDGTPCDDANACTAADTCNSGVCTGGAAVQCQASGPCYLAGVCNPTSGACSTPPVPDGTPCDDGNACTQGDLCQAGACVSGAPKTCAPADQCHLSGTCDPGTGLCSSPPAPDGAPCSDGDSCTLADACSGGSCKAGPPVVCAALSQCHLAGTCAPATGKCTNPLANPGTACDDGDVCTDNDTCAAGACSGAPHPCDDGIACTIDSCDPSQGGCVASASACACTDDAGCDDGNACNGVETCDKTTLQCKSGSPKDCSGMSGPCTSGACVPETGLCKAVPVSDGTTCDDGDACTLSDGCKAGACVGSSPVVCTKGGPCMGVGTCDKATGKCSKPPLTDGTTCDDGNACTKSDTCQGGACVGASFVQCAALSQCHIVGVCDVNTGLCSNPVKGNGAACNDGDACTKTDTCQNGTCAGGNPVVCPGASQCKKAGTCDPTSGVCSQPNVLNGTACGDGNACTVNDSCEAGACTSGPAVVCTAQSQCHLIGVCSPETGQCSSPLKASGATCEDGDLCTQGDTCVAGQCTAGSPKLCSSPPACHEATACKPATGACEYPASTNGKLCNDGNACTLSDACTGGACSGTPVTCTNNTLSCKATVGQCIGNGDCVYDVLADGTPCNDGSPCTVGDSCQAGVCTSTPKVCPPSSSPCKVATCKAKTGSCVDSNVTDGSICDDADACTLVDTCTSGACTGQGTLTNATTDYAVRVGTTAGPSSVDMIRRWDGSVGTVGVIGAQTTFAPGLTLTPPAAEALSFVTYPAGKSVPTTAKILVHSEGYMQIGAVSNADSDGGFVVSGSFNGTTVFGSGAGAVTLTASLADVFVAAFDVNGALKWVRHGSGGGLSMADGVVIAFDGSVWAVGNSLMPITFDSGTGTTGTTVAAGGTYLARWSSTGQLAQAILFASDTLGDVSFEPHSTGISLVASFAGTVTAGGGATPVTLTSAGSSDAVWMLLAPTDASVIYHWVVGGTEADRPAGVVSMPYSGAFATFAVSAGPNPSLRRGGTKLGLPHVAGTGKRDTHIITVNTSGAPLYDALIAGASTTQDGLALTTINGFQGVTVVATTDGPVSFYGAAGIGPGAPANPADLQWPGLAMGPKRLLVARFDHKSNFIWAADVGAVDAGIGKYQGWRLDAVQHEDLSVSLCGMFDKTATFGDAKPMTVTPFAGGSPFLMLMNSKAAHDLCP